MFILKVRIFRRNLIEDSVKQTVGQFHDVVFGKAGNFFSVMKAGVFKRVPNDFLRAGPRDQFQALDDLIRLTMFDTRVKILFILAHDHHVNAGIFRLDKWMIRNTRPHVRVEPERLPHRNIQTLEASALWRGDWRFEKEFRRSQ